MSQVDSKGRPKIKNFDGWVLQKRVEQLEKEVQELKRRKFE